MIVTGASLLLISAGAKCAMIEFWPQGWANSLIVTPECLEEIWTCQSGSGKRSDDCDKSELASGGTKAPNPT